MRKLIVGFLVIFSFITFSCSQVSNIAQREPIVLSPKTAKKGEFTFVIPANFVLDEKKSLIYQYGNHIRAYLFYIGKGSMDELVDFFNKYLYKLGWKGESTLVGEEGILTFSRNDQLLIVRISPKFQTTQLEVMLTKK